MLRSGLAIENLDTVNLDSLMSDMLDVRCLHFLLCLCGLTEGNTGNHSTHSTESDHGPIATDVHDVALLLHPHINHMICSRWYALRLGYNFVPRSGHILDVAPGTRMQDAYHILLYQIFMKIDKGMRNGGYAVPPPA